MSKYTIEIRHLRNTNFPFNNYLGSYPIWNEEYREILNNKILDHYHFREIALETPDRWGFRLRTKLNEIMPYYNELYLSTTIKFNPLYNVDIKESTTSERLNVENSSVDSSSNNTTNTSIHNDETHVETVGNELGGGAVTSTQLAGGDYASNVSVTNSDSTTDTSTSHGTNTGSSKVKGDRKEDSLLEKVIQGYHGNNPNQAIKEYRQNIINIDMMIIEELNSLFMGLLY